MSCPLKLTELLRLCMHLCIFQPCNLVHHFSGPVSSWSCIFIPFTHWQHEPAHNFFNASSYSSRHTDRVGCRYTRKTSQRGAAASILRRHWLVERDVRQPTSTNTDVTAAVVAAAAAAAASDGSIAIFLNRYDIDIFNLKYRRYRQYRRYFSIFSRRPRCSFSADFWKTKLTKATISTC